MVLKRHLYGYLFGAALMVVLGAGAMFVSEYPFFKRIGMSPLTLAIVFGMFLGNFRPVSISSSMENGIHFVQKRLLRAGIVLYGFRISFQEILGVGPAGFIIDLLVITTTFLVGTYLGVRLFGLDLETAILNSSGSSICGAAAVIATEGVVQGGSRKTAVAVSTVVLFGTISMFLYPLLFHIAQLSPADFGIYIGSTIHEVAQVVVAGESLGTNVASTAVIVKMTRVMLLAPFLIFLGWALSKKKFLEGFDRNRLKVGQEKELNSDLLNQTSRLSGSGYSLVIPWFAVGFIAVSGFHSLVSLPSGMIGRINEFDTLILSAAMAALGVGTNFHKMKGVGIRPFLHGFFLFGFLIFAGYGINRMVAGFFPG